MRYMLIFKHEITSSQQVVALDFQQHGYQVQYIQLEGGKIPSLPTISWAIFQLLTGKRSGDEGEWSWTAEEAASPF